MSHEPHLTPFDDDVREVWTPSPDWPDDAAPGASPELRALLTGLVLGALTVLIIWFCQIEYARHTAMPAPHSVVGVDG